MTVPALALIPVLTDPGTGTGVSIRTLDDELLTVPRASTISAGALRPL
jgi:hypothetical protein